MGLQANWISEACGYLVSTVSTDERVFSNLFWVRQIASNSLKRKTFALICEALNGNKNEQSPKMDLNMTVRHAQSQLQHTRIDLAGWLWGNAKRTQHLDRVSSKPIYSRSYQRSRFADASRLCIPCEAFGIFWGRLAHGTTEIQRDWFRARHGAKWICLDAKKRAHGCVHNMQRCCKGLHS